MKHCTHRQRLDILQTHIEAIQTAARELSKPDEYGIPFTVFEVVMLGHLVFQIDEAQEHMHSVFAGQLEDPLMSIQIKHVEIQMEIQQMKDENKHLRDELNQKLTMQLNQQQVTNYA
jgi:hypothetical protein